MESTLRDHAGWSMTSTMPSVYLHYFGTESSNSLLQAYGIIKDNNKNQGNGLFLNQCPNCREPNKPDSRFCTKCSMVLTYDAYNETLKAEKNEHDRLTSVEKQLSSTQHMLEQLITGLGKITDQDQLNTVAQSLFSSGVLKISATPTSSGK
jgi:hypothetical protein